MKSGLGTYAVQAGRIKVGAIVAVNALGDVYDIDNGQMIAGLRTPGRKEPQLHGRGDPRRYCRYQQPVQPEYKLPPLEPFSRMEPSIRAS